MKCAVQSCVWRLLLCVLVVWPLPAIPGDMSQETITGIRLNAPKRLENYRRVFEFIGRHELVSTGIAPELKDEVLIKLAADSTVSVRSASDGSPEFWVVRPDYITPGRKGSTSRIRGASGNGRFYVLMPRPELNAQSESMAFDVVGVLAGNDYKWRIVNHTPVIVSSWRDSSNRTLETVYSWNGGMFTISKSGYLVPK